MNFDLIKNILSLVVASIPLLIAIVALLRSRTDKTTEPVDITLKILKISHYPVSETEWKEFKRFRFFRYYIYCFLIFLIYAPTAVFIFRTSNIYLIITTFIILILTLFLYVLYFSNSYINISYKADDIKYYLFDKIDIYIESNVDYLINKCLNSMRIMNYKIVEINHNLKTIEAISTSSIIRPSIRIKVLIKESDASQDAFSIEFISFKYPSFFRYTRLCQVPEILNAKIRLNKGESGVG